MTDGGLGIEAELYSISERKTQPTKTQVGKTMERSDAEDLETGDRLVRVDRGAFGSTGVPPGSLKKEERRMERSDARQTRMSGRGSWGSHIDATRGGRGQRKLR